MVDPIVIPGIKELLALRSQSPTENEESFTEYFSRSAESPFSSIEEMVGTPEFNEITRYARGRFESVPEASDHYNYLVARDRLMHNVMKVMADYELDAIVYKAVEHQPTLIEDGVNPPFVNTKGVPFINTFLVYVPAIVVPAGFTTDELPVGITFMGRPYEDGAMLRLAYAYEEATHHRRPPSATPPLE